MWDVPYTHIFAIYDAINQYICAMLCAIARIQLGFFCCHRETCVRRARNTSPNIQWQKIHRFKSTSLSILLKAYKLNATYFHVDHASVDCAIFRLVFLFVHHLRIHIAAVIRYVHFQFQPIFHSIFCHRYRF